MSQEARLISPMPLSADQKGYKVKHPAACWGGRKGGVLCEIGDGNASVVSP